MAWLISCVLDMDMTLIIDIRRFSVRIVSTFFFLEKVEVSIIMKIFGIDVIFSAYITLHYKVSVVLLYLNHSKLGELSLLMS